MRSEDYSGLQGAQYACVKSVDYGGSRVEVCNSNGTFWVRVGQRKISGSVVIDPTTTPPTTVMAGKSEMPNVNDWGVVIPVNGDIKSGVWLCSVNSVEPTENLVNDSNYPGSAAKLVHRDYEKHETGSFSMLDMLGNLLMSWFKKATKETDTALQNLIISLNAGVLTLTHFRGIPSTRGLVVTSDQSGNLNIQNFQAGGLTLASSISIDSGGGFTLLTATGSQIRCNENGDVVLDNGGGSTITLAKATGNVTVNSPSVTLGPGTAEALLKAPGFIAAHNAHEHPALNAPPSVLLVPTNPALVTQNVGGS
jgi:hypothetical protein